MARNWIVTKDLFLSQDEVQHLYKGLRDAKDLALQRRAFFCHVRDYYILHTLLETGLRVFELTALRVSDFRNGSMIVRCGKGGKKRNVLLTKETQRMLTEFLKLKSRTLCEPSGDEDYLFVSERRKPYTTRGVRKRVKYWFGRTDISDDLS
jgi:site-specific recombinase XerD